MIGFLHVGEQRLLQFCGTALLVEFRIKSRVYRQLGEKGVRELLEGVALLLRVRDYERCRIYHHIAHVDLDLVPGEGVAPPGIDGLPLGVHDIVVLEEPLTDAEVVLLDLALGVLDALGEHGSLQYVAFLHSHAVNELGDPLGTEQTHELVLQGHVEHR